MKLLIKNLSMLLILLALTPIGFSVTGYFRFDNMNGYLLTLDNYGVNNVVIKMNCSVKDDNTNIRVFSAATNTAGYYTFTGQGDYFSDNFGQTEVTCFLWSADTKVINNNLPYKFNIIPGNYLVGASYNLVYDYYYNVQLINIISPNPANTLSASSANVVVSMQRGQNCTVNSQAMSKISGTYNFQKMMSFSHGANILTFRCTDEWSRTNTRQVTINNDIVGPSISLVSPTGLVGASANLTVFSSDAESCTANSQAMAKNGQQFSIILANLINGINNINVICLDLVGNQGVQQIPITSDSLSPQLQIISPQNISYANAMQLLNISASDSNINSTWYNWNGTNYTYALPVNITFAPDSNTLHVWANDSVGNINHTSVTFTIDIIASVLEIISPQNLTYNNLTQLVNIFSDGSNIWFFNGTENITYTAPLLINFSEGFNSLIAYANDSVGNLNTSSVSFTIDTIAPSLEIISPQNLTYNNLTQLVNLSSDGNNIWFFNGTENITYTAPLLINFSEGFNSLIAYANDSVGNLNSSIVSFTVDTIAPDLEIISPQNLTYNNLTQLVNISSNGAYTWYDWNGVNYSYADSLLITFNEGSNTLQAWANDSVSNINHTIVSFTVDTIAPYLEIINPQNLTYNNATLLVNISSDGNNTWFFSGSENITYTAPVLINFSEGSNTLHAWANDSIGNINHTVVSFTVDTIAPNLEIISPKNLTYNNATLLVNISSDGSNIWFSNGTENITYTVPMLVNFSEGSNTLQAWANDPVGNINYTSISFTIDTVAPQIYLSSPLMLVGSSAYINITTNEAGVCYLNDSIMNNDSSSMNHWIFNDTLINGPNIFNVTCRDLAYNYNSTFIQINSDTIAPVLEIISPQNLTYNNATLLVDIFSDGSSIWFSNGTENITYTAPLLINFSEGSNTLHAWANDSIGNINHTLVSFTIDTIAPALEIVAPQNMTYNNLTQLVNIFSDGSNIWFFNGTENITYTAPMLINFSEGNNTLQAWANDSIGNINCTSVDFAIDITLPALVIVSPQNMNYDNATLLVDIFSDGSSIWFSNGTENITYTAPMLVNFSEGSNTLQVWTNNSAGSIIHNEVSFVVDTISPDLQIIAPLNFSYNNAIQLVNISASDANLNVTWYNWNGTDYAYDGVINITFNEGNNTLQVWANDSAGNLNYTLVNFAIDTTAPLINAVSPINATYNYNLIWFNATADENITQWIVNYNGTNITLDSINSSLIVEDGTHNLFLYAKDAVDNLGLNNSVYFTVDTAIPSLEIVAPQNMTYNNLTQLVNISTGLDYSSVWFFNGTENITYTAPLLINFSEGSNTLQAWANDSIGNINHTIVSFTIDTIAPNLEIINPQNLTYNNTTLLVNLSSDGNNIWFSNGTENFAYTAPVLVNFSQGVNTLIAYVNDSAGNLNTSSVNFTVETFTLNLEIINPQNMTYNNATLLVNISSNGAYTWYNWNGTNYTYASPVNIDFNEGVNTLQAWANDSIGNINYTSVNFTVEYIITANDLIVQSLNLPDEAIVNYNYNLTSMIKNNGNSSAYVQVLYLDNGALAFNDSFSINAGELIESKALNLNFSKGNHNITIVAQVSDELNPSDNSLTSFVQSYYAIEKMDIDAMAPDEVAPNTNFTATVYAFNSLNTDYLIDNYAHSTLADITPGNYLSQSFINNSLIIMDYRINSSLALANHSFWANSSLQGEGVELASNNESIAVRNPGSPILSTDIIVMPKISNLYDSFVIARIYNYGNETAYNANATIILPSGVNLILGNQTNLLGNISNGTLKEINWTVRGDYAGDFAIGIKVESGNYDNLEKNIILSKPIISQSIAYNNLIYEPYNLTVKVFLNNTGANALVNISLLLGAGLSSDRMFEEITINNNTLNKEAIFNISSGNLENKTFKILVTENESGYYKESLITFSKRADPVLSTVISVSLINQTAGFSIAWNAVSQAAGYSIYRANAINGVYSLLLNTSANSYIDSSIANDTNYYYKIRAFNINSQPGNFSNIAYGRINSPVVQNTTTPPPAPAPSYTPIITPRINQSDNQSSSQQNTSQAGKVKNITLIMNDSILSNNQLINFSILNEIDGLLSIEEKLSFEIIKSNLLKDSYNSSGAHYKLSADLLSKMNYSVSNESYSFRESSKGIDMLVNVSALTVSINNINNTKYEITRVISNAGEVIANLTIYFELPKDSIVDSSVDFRDSKAFFTIDSLGFGESISLNYSFLSRANGDLAASSFGIITQKEDTNPLTAFVSLARSNKEIALSSLGGIIILSFAALIYVVRNDLFKAAPI